MEIQNQSNSKDQQEKEKEDAHVKVRRQIEQLAIEQTFSNKEPILDQIMKKGGCFRYQFKIVLLASMVMFVEGQEVCLSGLTFVPLMYSYNLNRFEACLAASILFIGMAFGSIFSGFLAEKGRRMIVSIALGVVFLATLLSMIDTVITFVLMRAVIGMSLGVIVPTMNTLLCEVLTPFCRGFWFTFVAMFFYIGASFSAIMMQFIYFNNWDKPRPELFFFILSTPVLIFAFLALYIQESPRFLLTRKRYDEGFDLLEHIYKGKIEDEHRSIIIKELAKENKSLDSNLASIFDKQFKSITFILTCIWVFYSFLVNGSVFGFMAGLLYSSSLSPEYLNNRYYYYTIELVSIYFLFLLSYLVAGCFSEIKFIGRKGLICLGFFAVFVASILAIFIGYKKEITLLIIDVFFINMSLHITNVYTCEIYPTKVRGIALGFFYFISRLVGFFANLATLFILEHRSNFTIYINTLIGLSGFVLTIILPVETYRRALDTKIQPKNDNSEGNSSVNTSDYSKDLTTNLDEDEGNK